MPTNPMRKFISDYLTPSERLSEALYSLILVLTVISAIELTISRNLQNSSTILLIAFGTNIAWGMVDAVVFVLTGIHKRNHHLRVVSRVKKRSMKDSIHQIEDELEDGLIGVLDKKERERIAVQVFVTMNHAIPKRQGVTMDDIRGGLANFLISFLVVLPPLMPFVLDIPLGYALRLSDVIAVAMLFLVGYLTGGREGMSRIRWALTIMVLGVVIVIVTILLGG